MAVKKEIVSAEDVKWELSEARPLLSMIRSAILTGLYFSPYSFSFASNGL